MRSFGHDETGMMELVAQLDSFLLSERIAALESLCHLEQRGQLTRVDKVGPTLPSYDHVHTTASYGFSLPGVFSAAHMVWAAHESEAYSTVIVEHESLVHLDEARRAVEIVNRGSTQPLRLLLGVEFKAPVAIDDEPSRQFSEGIRKVWGQGDAAWVVAMGASPSGELTRLVRQFQEAKRLRAHQQLERLNHHLALAAPLELADLLTPEGNVTDRLLCFAVAKAKWPEADQATRDKHARSVRKMLNPGGPAHVPFPAGLPSYQELIRMLADLGMTPTFTTQLCGPTFDTMLPWLKACGIRALDVAGIDPDNPDAECDVQQVIALAEKYKLLLFGGADYRGVATGWARHMAWMDHPLIRATIDRLCVNPQVEAAAPQTIPKCQSQ
jgi:hypothetical protein